MADVAVGFHHKLVKLGLHHFGSGFLISALQNRHDAVERRLIGSLFAVKAEKDFQFLAVVAVENHFFGLFRQILKRHGRRKPVLVGHGFYGSVEALRNVDAPVGCRRKSAFVDGKIVVLDQFGRVDDAFVAQSQTFRTGSVRIVEAERARRKFLYAYVAVRAAVVCGIKRFRAVHINRNQPFGKL